MSRLASLKPRQVIRALERAGFVVVRIRGSHHIMAHKDDPRRFTNVPFHTSRDLPRVTLADIIKQSGLTLDEFLALL
jgi:predicted RNA binding protein YcfA (HicA-like mRNA interferase family)